MAISKTYEAYSNILFSNIDDRGTNHTITLHQEGIIDSNDIIIILDYDKDYPTRLFDNVELYYGNVLIARNRYLPYLFNVDDTKMFKISDIFPNYKFTLDTTNKPLSLKLQRNTISTKINKILISYKINNNNVPKPLLKHDSTIAYCYKCKNCGNYKTTILMDYEPKDDYIMYYIYGCSHYTDENYSNKPIKQLVYDLQAYVLNDEKIDAADSFPQLHKGENRYSVKLRNKNIKDSDCVNCIIYYNF